MDLDPSSPRIPPEQRERMVRGFAAWLDRALDDELPPEGLAAELISALRNGEELPALEGTQSADLATGWEAGLGCDLYSLWAAMTALSQEVRLQGRMFKQLNETLLQSGRRRDAQGQEAPAAESGGESRSEPVPNGQPRKQEIDVLLDLRDRLERGIANARQAAVELAPSRLPRLARWLGVGGGYAGRAQEVLAALSDGCSLMLARLDEALVACGLDRIACHNRLFDPQRMTAVEIEETGSVPEGTVVEVYRDGYEWNGKVYRTAQVKVARNQEGKFQ